MRHHFLPLDGCPLISRSRIKLKNKIIEGSAYCKKRNQSYDTDRTPGKCRAVKSGQTLRCSGEAVGVSGGCARRGGRHRTSRRRLAFCQRFRGDDRSLDAAAATHDNSNESF